MPVIPDWSTAMASIKTDGKLFITDDKKAEINPIPKMLFNNPYSEICDNISAKTVVIPTFFKPNTTKYIPNEKITIFQGASLMTRFVCTALDLRANNTNSNANAPAIIDTGI